MFIMFTNLFMPMPKDISLSVTTRKLLNIFCKYSHFLRLQFAEQKVHHIYTAENIFLQATQ